MAYFESMPVKIRREWEIRKATKECSDSNPDFNRAIVTRAQKRMARVDAMAPDLRRVVYEYNLEVVQEFLNHGVKSAKSIKHLIDTVTGADFVNGQPRFKLNVSPNRKRNSIDLADEEDEYWSIPKSR